MFVQGVLEGVGGGGDVYLDLTFCCFLFLNHFDMIREIQIYNFIHQIKNLNV